MPASIHPEAQPFPKMYSGRRKLFLLISTVAACFALALFGFWLLERKRMVGMEKRRLVQQSQSLDRFLRQWSASLATFSTQYGGWDEMREAVKNGDGKKLEELIDKATMDRFRVNAYWVYRADQKLLATHNELYSDQLKEAPVSRNAIRTLFASKEARFFRKVSSGIMEIQGSPIHGPGADAPTEGYLLAARLWSDEEMKEMSVASGYELRLVEPSYSQEHVVMPNGDIAFTRPLEDADGKVVGRLLARSESSLLRYVDRLRLKMWIVLLTLSIGITSAVFIGLNRWVWHPLQALLQSLRSERPAALGNVDRERSEIGEMARLIRGFLDQRETLVKELHDRRMTEKALRDGEEQHIQQQKMEAVSRLAGGVSEDFNNLLTAIIGFGGLLQDKLKDRADAKADADKIVDAGERAAALTRQLLAFSRKQVVQPKLIDVNQFIAEADDEIKKAAGNVVELRIEADAPKPWTKIDPEQFSQIVLPLIRNASDAMSTGGILTISTMNTVVAEPTELNGAKLQAGTYVTFSVSDTGQGMEPEIRERMFEPFFTTKDQGKGVGLSLAMVYGVTQQVGGAIAVQTNPGRGTTVLVHLPLSAADAVTTEESRPVRLPARKEGETFLIIEDDSVVRALLISVLHAKGHRALVLGTPDATARLRPGTRSGFRVVISDLVQAQKEDFETIRTLQMNTPEVDVLLIGSYVDAEEIQVPTGAEVLPKPFTAQALGERIDQILHRSFAS